MNLPITNAPAAHAPARNAPALNIVHLSTFEPFDIYLHQQVRRAWPGVKALRVVWPTGKDTRKKRLKRSPLDAVLRSLEWRLFYARRTEALRIIASQQLFGSDVPPTIEAAAEVTSTAVNSGATVQLLHELKPDLLLVSNAPILKPAVFGIPPLGTINLHRGITPEYRGEHTFFWPILRRDYEKVGVTLHYIDDGIDTGDVLAQASLDLSSTDNDGTLNAKAARAAAELVLRFLPCAIYRPRGQKPSEGGRLWYARERRAWHDLQLMLRRQLGEAIPETSGSSRLYFSESRSGFATSSDVVTSEPCQELVSAT
jgi:methionyl-tRNA formyltransferase